MINLPSSWRQPTFVFSIALLGLIALYWQTLDSMIAIWLRSGTFAHGFLMLPMSGFLIWERRKQLALMTPQPSAISAGLFAMVSLVWLMAVLVDVLVVQQFAWVTLLILLVAAIFGRPIFSALLFPLGYLYFMVPFGEFLVPTLMNFTAIFTVKMVELSGIPVFHQGMMISLPSSDWEVAKACSGIRYLIALLALGAFYAYIQYTKFYKRVLFILICFITAVLANGLRAYGIVMIGHFSNLKYATGLDHIIYGWLFFGLLCVLLFWAGRLWQDRWTESNPQVQGTSARPAKPMLLTLTLGLLAAPMLYLLLQTSAPQNVIVQLPVAAPSWTPVQRQTGWAPSFAGANQEFMQSFRNNNDNIDVFLAYYYHQQKGQAELISSNHLFYNRNSDVWRRVAQSKQQIFLADDKTLNVVETHMVNQAQQHRLIWGWYVVGGRATHQLIRAKVLELWSIITGNRQQSGIVGVKIDPSFQQTAADARRRLTAFIQDHYPGLMHSFQSIASE